MKNKKLNQKVKELKKNIAIAEDIEETANGNAIVDIAVADLDDFYSPYSPKGYKLLNPEMVEYIDEYAKGIPISQELTLRISAENQSVEAKKRIEKTIRRTYAEKIANINEDLQRNLLSSITFMIIGLIFLVGVIITSAYKFSDVIYEVLDIISWVFIWEAVDVFFMERHKKRVEKIKYSKLAVAEIIFV